MTFQDEVLEDLERDFGRTLIVRRITASSYDLDSGEPTEAYTDYEITMCLIRRLKNKLDYQHPGITEAMNAHVNRADLKVVIRRARLAKAGIPTIIDADRIIIDSVTYQIKEIDDRMADTYVIYLRRAA